jgi:predicted NAD/FAD-binding protein
VAIVGAGASGLAAAWLLAEDADVVVFEREARLGGHAHTVEIGHDGSRHPVDLGAQFFHPSSYPTFLRLLERLGVATRSSQQTFTVLEDEGRSFFRAGAALRNVIGPGSALRRQWLGDLLRLSTGAWTQLRSLPWSVTLQEALPLLKLSPSFVERVLYPVVGASFGTLREQSAEMSARSALYYLTSGLRPVALARQPYRQIVGGCASWLREATRHLSASALRTNTAVTQLVRGPAGWHVARGNDLGTPFDHVIVAVQPNVAARLLAEVSGCAALCARFRSVRYVRADLVIHGDVRVMPPDLRAWSGFVVHDSRWAPGATVWLGQVAPRRLLFKTWASRVPVRGPTHASATFAHPVMDRVYYAAQDAARARSTADGLHFASSFATSVDNHESAIVAALGAAQAIAPWSRRVRALSSSDASAWGSGGGWAARDVTKPTLHAPAR